MGQGFILQEVLSYNMIMLRILFALSGVLFLLLCSEYLWRKKIIRGEYARKFVHIFVGVFVAFWPYFLTFRQIKFLAIAFILVLAISRYFKIFHAIHDIKRPSLGALLYPIAILVLATYADQKWIFTVGVLFEAVADGIAAVAGKLWGNRWFHYIVYGNKKTFIGSVAFLFGAYIALCVGYLVGGGEAMLTIPLVVFLWMPLSAAILEASTPFGFDNLFTPIYVMLVLNLAQTNII